MYNEITIYDLNIVEDYSDIKASVREDILEMGEDTVTFLNNYVDQLETDVSKLQKSNNRLKKGLKWLGGGFVVTLTPLIILIAIR